MRVRSRRRRLARTIVLSAQLLAAHPLRTALSIASVAVGVASVVAMVSIGAGAQRRLVKRIGALGTNLLIVSAAPAPRIAGRQRQVATLTTLRPSDAAAILESTSLATAAAPAVTGTLTARWEGRNVPTTVTGTTVDGLRIRNVRATSGRVFDELEDRERRRVALVGTTVARNLFGAADPVGREIRIGTIPFEVIGVMNARGTDVGGVDQDDLVIVPLETAMRRVLNVPYVHAVLVQARSSDRLDALEAEVREILGERHGARSGLGDPLVIRNQAVLLRTERGTTRALSGLTIVVAGLALVVGGVGVMAVMLLAVRERIREIGLRRAVGARRSDVRLQFLLESAMLALSGGIAGVVFGLVAGAAVAAIGPWDFALSFAAVAVGLAGSTLIGVLSGVIPAVRAARLDPIAALRAE